MPNLDFQRTKHGEIRTGSYKNLRLVFENDELLKKVIFFGDRKSTLPPELNGKFDFMTTALPWTHETGYEMHTFNLDYGPICLRIYIEEHWGFLPSRTVIYDFLIVKFREDWSENHDW